MAAAWLCLRDIIMNIVAFKMGQNMVINKKLVRMLVSIMAILCLILAGELYARYKLGLGDPPISIADPEIDYLFKPNQACNRFGNTILYNNCSMRCDFNCFPRFNGTRIFVVGDSVVNGGALTSHVRLATTILQDKIDASRQKIQVCNVSAGSWGPGNYAAWFKKYKNLVSTNDVLIVELDSHDLWEDDPLDSHGINVGKDIALVDAKPCCALWEGVARYFIPLVRRKLGLAAINTKVDVARWKCDIEDPLVEYNLNALNSIFSMPFRYKFVLIHRSRKETKDGNITIGEAKFREYSISKGVNIIELALDSNEDYRDIIHISDTGHKKMAHTIYDRLKSERIVE